VDPDGRRVAKKIAGVVVIWGKPGSPAYVHTETAMGVELELGQNPRSGKGVEPWPGVPWK